MKLSKTITKPKPESVKRVKKIAKNKQQLKDAFTYGTPYGVIKWGVDKVANAARRRQNKKFDVEWKKK